MTATTNKVPNISINLQNKENAMVSDFLFQSFIISLLVAFNIVY